MLSDMFHTVMNTTSEMCVDYRIGFEKKIKFSDPGKNFNLLN
jgi:hypothetical protein